MDEYRAAHQDYPSFEHRASEPDAPERGYRTSDPSFPVQYADPGGCYLRAYDKPRVKKIRPQVIFTSFTSLLRVSVKRDLMDLS